MNQPDAQTMPNYFTCPCQYCSGKIEFDANQLDAAENTIVPCPHCGLETIIFVPEQRVPPVLTNENKTPRTWETYEAMRRAAESADLEAECNMGICYHNGYGIAKDDNEAVKWFFKAASHGFADAENFLGMVYGFDIGDAVDVRLGSGLPKDYTEAVKWWRKAAEQGHSAAQFNLGFG